MANSLISTAQCVWTSALTVCLVLLIQVLPVQCQSCVVDNFDVQENFDVDRYLGKWYEIKWIKYEWIEEEDVFTNYWHEYVKVNNTVIDVQFKGRPITSSDDAACVSGHDILVSTSTDEPGKFTQNKRYNDTDRFWSIMWVISTDYDNYALTYGCRERSASGICVLPDGWLWSRKQTISEEHEDRLDQILPDLCLQPSMFTRTSQDAECSGLVLYPFTLLISVMVGVSIGKFWL